MNFKRAYKLLRIEDNYHNEYNDSKSEWLTRSFQSRTKADVWIQSDVQFDLMNFADSSFGCIIENDFIESHTLDLAPKPIDITFPTDPNPWVISKPPMRNSWVKSSKQKQIKKSNELFINSKLKSSHLRL